MAAICSRTLKFRCPICGSNIFGNQPVVKTQENKSKYPDGTLLGHCHGIINTQTSNQTHCAFTWARTLEMDARVFAMSELWIMELIYIQDSVTRRFSGSTENKSNTPKTLGETYEPK